MIVEAEDSPGVLLIRRLLTAEFDLVQEPSGPARRRRLMRQRGVQARRT